MNPQSIIYLIKLMLETGALSPVVAPATFEETFKEPEMKVGDYCENSFGLPIGTICVNNRVQPRLK